MLSSHFVGITSFIICIIRLVLVSTLVSLANFNISDMTPNGPAAFLFFMLLNLSESDYSYTKQTLYSKASHDNFSELISYLHHCRSTIISYALPTNNILISFDHALWNLANITFLIISPYNASKYFPLCFILAR